MYKKLIALAFVAGMFSIAAPTLAAGTLDVPAACDGQPVVLTVTQNITEADTGSHGTWATDTFTETAQVYESTDPTYSYCVVGTVDSGGTFTTTGPNSPQNGDPLAAGITGTLVGGETWLIPSGTTFTGAVTGSTYTATPVNNPAADSQFSNWQNEVFGSTVGANTFTFTYTTDADPSIVWTNEDVSTGDITNPTLTTVYVDSTTGSDSNIGSQNAPFATIQAAVDAVASGGTVNVAAGTYSEDVTIHNSLSLTGVGAGSSEIDGQVTVDAPDTTVSGFTITNPNGNFGIFVNHEDTVTVSNNTIENIGTGAATGNVFGVYFQDENSTDNSIFTVDGNTIHDIGTTANGSNGGIGIGDSTGTGILMNFRVTNNTISNITANTTAVSPGKGAYGIQINHAASPNTGTTANVVVRGNTISGLNGRWAHAIALEGNTPSATVQNNIVSNLSATSATNDAVGVMFEDNDNTSSATVENNSIDSSTVAWGVVNATSGTAHAENNYWATSTPANIMFGDVSFSPWFSDSGMTTLGYTITPSGSDNTATTGSGDTSLSGDSTQAGSVTVTVVIPANTTITGDSSWDGTIEAPTATTATLSISGFDTNVTSAVTIGSNDSDLTFSQPVKLEFSGQAGQRVGFFNHAGDFNEITDSCDINDTATTINGGASFTAGGACKIDALGDLVVYTEHFSTFVTYTATAVSSGGSSSASGGGGGGSGAGNNTGGQGVGNANGAFVGSGGNAVIPSGNPGNTGGEVLGAEAHQFTVNLRYSMQSDEVMELQKSLIAAGFDIPLITKSHVPYGYFGPQTFAATKAFQKAHGIIQTGFVGPLTRAELNKLP